MTAERQRLPNRRPHCTEHIEHGGQRYYATVGFYPETGQPGELFVSAAKVGAQIDDLIGDAATAISVALQYGVTATAMAKSMARIRIRPVTPQEIDEQRPDDTIPATVIGVALDLLKSYELED